MIRGALIHIIWTCLIQILKTGTQTSSRCLFLDILPEVHDKCRAPSYGSKTSRPESNLSLGRLSGMNIEKETPTVDGKKSAPPNM